MHLRLKILMHMIHRWTNKKIEKALYYLNKKWHERWLLEFVGINKKYEDITDDEIINEISNTFIMDII